MNDKALYALASKAAYLHAASNAALNRTVIVWFFLAALGGLAGVLAATNSQNKRHGYWLVVPGFALMYFAIWQVLPYLQPR